MLILPPICVPMLGMLVLGTISVRLSQELGMTKLYKKFASIFYRGILRSSYNFRSESQID